jgi:beta-lactamase regulating signal transducer with metallopeptidase domain
MTPGTELLSSSTESVAWIGMIGEAALKGTFLLLAAFILSLALRRASAASRHLVWALCLCLLLLLPVLAQIAPPVAAPAIPPSWSAAWAEVVDAAGSRVSALLGSGHGSIEPASSISLSGPLELDRAIGVVGTTVHLESVPVEGGRDWPATTWLASTWIAGLALVLGWLAVGLWLRRSLSRHAREARGGPWVEEARSIAVELGIRRELVLLRGAEDAVPMTWGNLRPVIYLPPGADEWPVDQRRSVLLHELAHVRRWDSLTRSISQIACAIFWFHPFAWYAAHRLLREQERACDDVVLLAGAEPDEYATTLLTLARHYRQRRPAVVGALALARRTKLENRLISILDPRRKRITMSRTHRVALLATFVAVAVPLAALQPAPAEPLITSSPPAVSTASEHGSTRLSQQAAASTSSTVEPTPVQMIVKGEVHLGSSLDEIQVGPGGRFVLQELESAKGHLELESADPERGRRLEITADGEGNVERAWTVDGATRRIDDQARDWINEILGRLDSARVQFSSAGSDETRTLIFAGDRLALVSEAHAVAEGDRVLHLRPGVAWTTEESEEGAKIELRLAQPIVTAEGVKIDLHLARPIEVEEGGTWTIHIDEPELLLHKGEHGESLVLELKKAEGDESFTVVAPRLELIGEDDERKVVVLVPEVVAEAKIHPRVHVELAEGHEQEPMTIVIERSDDERHRRSIRVRSRTDEEGGYFEMSMRGEVDLGETIDDIVVGEGGELTIDARDAEGVIRQLSVRPDPEGDLLFEYYVDGEERPFDDAARAWLQEILERVEE